MMLLVIAVVLGKLILDPNNYPEGEEKSFIDYNTTQDLIDYHRYDVEFGRYPVVLNFTNVKEALIYDEEEYSIFKGPLGYDFKCRFQNFELTEAKEYKKPQDLFSLLEPIGCLTKKVGFWTFEYCHLKQIRQYKLASDPEEDLLKNIQTKNFKQLSKTLKEWLFKQSKIEPKLDFVIGRFVPGEENLLISSDLGIKVDYVDGEQCEKLGVVRKTMVKFFCDPDTTVDYIDKVYEVKGCEYVMKIGTFRICPATPHKVPRIHCTPVSPLPHIEDTFQPSKSTGLSILGGADLFNPDLLKKFISLLTKAKKKKSKKVKQDNEDEELIIDILQ